MGRTLLILSARLSVCLSVCPVRASNSKKDVENNKKTISENVSPSRSINTVA